MKKLATTAAILLVLVAFLVWWFQPVNVVTRRTGALLDTIRIPASTGTIGRNARAGAIGGFLAPRVELSAPDHLEDELGGTLDRDHLAGMFAALARACHEVELGDPEALEASVDGDSAIVRFRIEADARMPNRPPVEGRHEVEIRWVKGDGRWLLKKARWSELP